MSTSSENSIPSLPKTSDLSTEVASWDAFKSTVGSEARDSFSEWLEADLDGLEARLSRFKSKNSTKLRR